MSDEIDRNDAARDVFERFERDRRIVSSRVRSPWVPSRCELVVSSVLLLAALFVLLMGGS